MRNGCHNREGKKLVDDGESDKEVEEVIGLCEEAFADAKKSTA